MRLLELGYELPNNWREATISDVTSKVGSGATPRGGSSVYTNNGIPLVRSQNVLDNSFSNAGLAFLSDQSASSLKNVELRANDVLLNITGDSILRCCLLPDVMIGGRVNQHVAIIRASDAVIPLYLQKWLVQDWFKDFMLSHSAGATRKAITKGQILSFPIALPPLPEQRRIAGVLGALDDKIESNCAQQRIGEQLLRAVIEGILGQFSEADFISFDAYCTQSKESVRPENIGNGDKYIALEHMPRGSVFLNSWETAKLAGIASNKTRFRHGDLLFGKLRPYFKKVGVAPVSGVCSTDILVIRPRLPEFLPFIAVIASSDALIDSISASATGTRMPRASWKEIATWPVPQIPDETLTVLLHPANQLMAFLETLSLQNLKLAQLRDALLPELMSGRMRVDEAGRLVSETLGEEVR